MRAWRKPLSLLLALLALGAAAPACNLIAGVPSIADGGSGASETCTAAAECDDGEPCTTDTCSGSRCVHAARADGPLPANLEVAGDCVRVTCVAGASATQFDDEDAPDDGKDCTIDTCDGGKPAHTPKPPSTTCDDGVGNAGRCDAKGACVVTCSGPGDCASTNPCKVASCDTAAGQCVLTDVADGAPTPGAAQTAGDCHKNACVGGVATDVVDDLDVGSSTSDCAVPSCKAGVPSLTPEPAGTACHTYKGTEPGFCDGTGACEECTQAAHCPGPTDDCQQPACTAGVCGMKHTAAMTPTTGNPAQIVGDCLEIICNGSGGKVPSYDSTDPADDGNPCTSDVCAAANTTTHQVLPDGTACGTAGLTCVGGVCAGCTTSSQCPQGSCNGTVYTLPTTCDPSTTLCVAPSPATQQCAPYLCGAGGCTTDCGGDAECAAGAYCSAGKCLLEGASGATCTGNNGCQSGFCVDGVCCSTACGGTCQACSAAKKGSGANGACGPILAGTDPDNECTAAAPSTCGNTGSCDGGGACAKYTAGTVCRPSAGACDVAEACPGNGAACPANAFAPATTFCRPAAGGCDVAEQCTGASPTCPADLLAPQGTVCRAAAQVCDAAEICDGTGVMCPVDGYISQGSTDSPLCTGANACDGAGSGASHCKLKTGQPCTSGMECVSAVCTAMVCL